jgi:hypothetical protein
MQTYNFGIPTPTFDTLMILHDSQLLIGWNNLRSHPITKSACGVGRVCPRPAYVKFIDNLKRALEFVYVAGVLGD